MLLILTKLMIYRKIYQADANLMLNYAEFKTHHARFFNEST